MSNAGNASNFSITDARLYVPIVILRTEDNTKLSKLLSEGFKRPIYWNKHKVIFRNYNNEDIRERIDASFQGVNKLFVLPYASGNNITDENSYRTTNYNIEIDRRNFYDQPISDSVKQYDEVRKISTGKGDDCTTGCLLYFAYFEKNYKIIAAGLSK